MPLYRAPAQGYTHQGIRIPLHIAEGIEQWIQHGRRPDAFLLAVLSNDLQGAFGTGDATARVALHAIVVYLYNEAPGPCWGSPAKVQAWAERKQYERNEHATPQPDGAGGRDPDSTDPEDARLSNLPHDA